MVQLDFNWAKRWVIASSNPFISTAARQEIDTCFQEIATEAPEWFAAWTAGHLSDLIATLDDDDPWRHLNIVDGQARHPNGSPFGSWVDGTDLTQAQSEDPSLDLGLAGFAEPLSEKAAVLVAISEQGWSATYEWASQNLIGDGVEAGELFSDATSAIRYAKSRRMQYEGFDDHFSSMSGSAWVGRAARIVANQPWDESGAARFRDQSKVFEGKYSQLV